MVTENYVVKAYVTGHDTLVIAIPKPIRNRFGILRGEYFIVTANDHTIEYSRLDVKPAAPPVE